MSWWGGGEMSVTPGSIEHRVSPRHVKAGAEQNPPCQYRTGHRLRRGRAGPGLDKRRVAMY
eukprot:1199703-Rhodomonas_salina.1